MKKILSWNRGRRDAPATAGVDAPLVRRYALLPSVAGTAVLKLSANASAIV